MGVCVTRMRKDKKLMLLMKAPAKRTSVQQQLHRNKTKSKLQTPNRWYSNSSNQQGINWSEKRKSLLAQSDETNNLHFSSQNNLETHKIRAVDIMPECYIFFLPQNLCLTFNTPQRDSCLQFDHCKQKFLLAADIELQDQILSWAQQLIFEFISNVYTKSFLYNTYREILLFSLNL